MRYLAAGRAGVLRTAAVLGIAVLAGACGGDAGEESPQSSATDSVTASQTAGPGAMTDAQILAVLSVADSAEILPSQLAETQAQAAPVKEYARMMMRDHGALDDSLMAVAQANGLTPEQNPTSQQMRAEAETTVQSLQSLSGAAFDSAYVAAMIASHQTALTAIDSQLLPAAQNAQLRAALEQRVRPAVVAHLEQAQRLQQGQ